MDKNEFNRLDRAMQKVEKSKNKQALYDWAIQLENQLIQQNEKEFKEDLARAIDIFKLTIYFSLHFSEKTKFGQKRLDEFMEDLVETINLFSTHEYSPLEYKKMLEDDGINVNIDLSYLEERK